MVIMKCNTLFKLYWNLSIPAFFYYLHYFK